MDFVIDAIKLENLLRAAACDCWWEDGDSKGYGITFSRLLQLVNESQRKSEESWVMESDAWIQIALMRLGIMKPASEYRHKRVILRTLQEMNHQIGIGYKPEMKGWFDALFWTLIDLLCLKSNCSEAHKCHLDLKCWRH